MTGIVLEYVCGVQGKQMSIQSGQLFLTNVCVYVCWR